MSVFLFALFAGSPAQSQTTLTLGHGPSLKAALDVVALENGYFAKEGLDVTLVDVGSGNIAIEKLINGELDVAESTLFPFVALSFERHDLRIFATECVARNDNVIVARKDRGIETAKDLRGKKIGILPSSFTDYILGLMLLNEGIEPTDLTIVHGDLAQLLGQFKAGQLDGLGCAGAWIDRAKTAWPDTHVVLLDENIARVAIPLAARTESLEKNPDLYARLLRALVRAEDFLEKDPEKAFAMACEHFKIDPAESKNTWHPDIFAVRLDQSMIRDMENMAQWQIDTGIANGSAIPNVLESFDFGPLGAVDPKRISVIH